VPSPPTDRLLAEIGRRVRAARLRVGLSQQKAATATKSDPRYFQRLETGRLNPTVATLARIANGLGVTFFDLVCTDENAAHDRPPPKRTARRRR
jgi:transcriptional regulator with XRE-family HTH domain